MNEVQKILDENVKDVIDFLKERFPDGIQTFNTRNDAGDPMATIYLKNGIQIDWCGFYEYIEIFGLTDEQFKQVQRGGYTN